MDNEKWMDQALEKARESLKNGEVPVGCLFVYKNEVIATGNNTVNETRNATRHAELNCIDAVLKFCQTNDLISDEVFRNIDVIVTVEPCIMCASALHQLQVRSIIYGCANDRFGGCKSVYDVSNAYSHKGSNINVIGNVKGEEAMQLLKDFYKGTNPNAPESNRKKRKKDN